MRIKAKKNNINEFSFKLKEFFSSFALLVFILFCVTLSSIETYSQLTPSVEARVVQIIDGKKDLNKNGTIDPYEDWALSVDARVNDLLGRMTKQQKAYQMMHPNWSSSHQDLFQNKNIGFMLVGTGISASVSSAAQTTNSIQEYAERSALGIPVILSMDSVMGVSYVKGATLFPDQLGLASTNDLPLILQLAEMQRQESLAIGVRMTLSPQADIACDPRWGRIQCTFGENNQITREWIPAIVQILQHGSELNPLSLLVCVKHAPGAGNQEKGYDIQDWETEEDTVKLTFTAQSEKYHMEVFKDAINAGAGSIMPYHAYLPIRSPYWDGDRPHESAGLMQSWLKQSLGAQMIQTDWPPIDHLRAATNGADALGGVSSLSMTTLINNIVSQVPDSRVDDAVRRILTVKFKMGLFEDPYVDQNAATGIVGTQANKNLALQAAKESIVLLKNSNNILPLSKSTRVYVGGDRANDISGQNSGWKVTPNYGTSIITGIRNKIGTGNVVSSINDADAAVIAVGEGSYIHGAPWSGNNFWGPKQLQLSDTQAAQIQNAVNSGKPVIVVVIMARPYAMEADTANAAGLIVTSHPGPDGGTAIADVLFGDYNPTGRLPVAIPRTMAQVEEQREDLPYDLGATASERTDIENKIGSGQTLNPADYGDPLYPYGFGLNYSGLGDVNHDDIINIIDALMIAQHYVGLTPQNFDVSVADTNCDGSVTIIDALVVAQYYVGLITEFC